MRHSRRPPRCADRFRDLTVAACAVALGSCASASPAEPAHPFEVYYREGDWTAALSTFEADSTLWADDWAVYRTALIYARPDRET